MVRSQKCLGVRKTNTNANIQKWRRFRNIGFGGELTIFDRKGMYFISRSFLFWSSGFSLRFLFPLLLLLSLSLSLLLLLQQEDDSHTHTWLSAHVQTPSRGTKYQCVPVNYSAKCPCLNQLQVIRQANVWIRIQTHFIKLWINSFIGAESRVQLAECLHVLSAV